MTTATDAGSVAYVIGGDGATGATLAHRNFKRPRGLPTNTDPEGLDLAELAPGLLPWPDSTGTRRFALSLFCLDIRVDPGPVDIEPTYGAAPAWLPLAAQLGARFL